VFSLFFEPGESKGNIPVLYRMFFDDTADGKAEKYVVAAGLLGRYRDWRAFGERQESSPAPSTFDQILPI